MKVLLIDDHPLILSAMQSVILGLDREVVVCGVESAAECRRVLGQRHDFDLVLLDLHLGDASGFDLLAELRRDHPALPVVVVSASDQAGDVIRAIDAGAMGFVPKRASNELLFEALHLVMSGGIYVPPMDQALGGDPAVPVESARSAGGAAAVGPLMPMSRSAVVAGGPVSSGEGLPAGLRRPGGLPASLADLGLTPRQRQVMQLLLHGKSNKMIARDLDISVETVKDHVAAVLRSLGVKSRTQAVLAVGLLGEVSPGSPR